MTICPEMLCFIPQYFVYTLVFNTRYSRNVWKIYYWWYFLRGDVEESGVKWGMELLLEKVVMRQFKPTQFPNPYHIKPYMSTMLNMLHNTANSPICQLHLLQIYDKMGYKNVWKCLKNITKSYKTISKCFKIQEKYSIFVMFYIGVNLGRSSIYPGIFAPRS